MKNEYYAVIRSTDHLEHYGVKGMKWGVRKAIATGNSKALDRHFRKAAKKLAKLTDLGLNSKKYAAKAAAYGAAAAGTGTIAVKGTDAFKSLKGWGKKSSKLFPVEKIPTTRIPRTRGMTKNDIFRIATGAAAASLAALTAKNLYRATHGAKYRAKAVQFKNEMDKAFSGTKYASKYVARKKSRKKRG